MKLTDIPVHDAGPNWPLEVLETEKKRAHALIDRATRFYPHLALKAGDSISRNWLVRNANSFLDEIDNVASSIGRPGTYFLNVNYEWGCTTRAGRGADGQTARLVRILDWKAAGLGEHLIAVKISSEAGPWFTLTWPGYTGVLHGMAPGRFSAALNQAPMDMPMGFMPADWIINRSRVWKSQDPTPAHLLREIFERARDFNEAKRILIERPICIPTIFSLAGLKPQEGVIIERKETEARVLDTTCAAANQWQSPGWHGRERGANSEARAKQMSRVIPDLDENFEWLKPPVLNPTTRVALVADAAMGRAIAQGFEKNGPVTNVLSIQMQKCDSANVTSNM